MSTSATETRSRRYAVSLGDLAAQRTAVVRGRVSSDAIAAFLGGAYEEVAAALGRQGLVPAGPPVARYAAGGGGFEVEADLPL